MSAPDPVSLLGRLMAAASAGTLLPGETTDARPRGRIVTYESPIEYMYRRAPLDTPLVGTDPMGGVGVAVLWNTERWTGRAFGGWIMNGRAGLPALVLAVSDTDVLMGFNVRRVMIRPDWDLWRPSAATLRAVDGAALDQPEGGTLIGEQPKQIGGALSVDGGVVVRGVRDWADAIRAAWAEGRSGWEAVLPERADAPEDDQRADAHSSCPQAVCVPPVGGTVVLDGALVRRARAALELAVPELRDAPLTPVALMGLAVVDLVVRRAHP